MLYITLSNGRELGWHTSDPKTSRKELSFKVNEVVEIQADGDELTRILNCANNLPQRPHRECRVQNWFGDDAKWIVANIITSPW